MKVTFLNSTIEALYTSLLFVAKISNYTVIKNNLDYIENGSYKEIFYRQGERTYYIEFFVEDYKIIKIETGVSGVMMGYRLTSGETEKEQIDLLKRMSILL